MLTKKYFISIERRNLVCNENGTFSQVNYFKFLKSKNNFISESYNKQQIIIKSPVCSDFNNCYDKFEEIFNVVSRELYEEGLIIWPYNELNATDKKDISNFKINFSIEKSFLQTLKIKDYKKINFKLKETLDNNKWMIAQILYGFSCRHDYTNDVLYPVIEHHDIDKLIKIEAKPNSIQIHLSYSNIFDKCGIKRCDLAFLICYIFECLIFNNKPRSEFNSIIKNDVLQNHSKLLKEEVKKLIMLDEKYILGCKKELQELYDLLSTQKSKQATTNIYEDNAFILNLAKGYYKDSSSSKYIIKKYPKLDGSAVVLIKDALSQGIDFNVVDEAKSFVEFVHNKHIEYVILATMTNRDSYILSYITDDKQFAKDVLNKKKLRTPDGRLLSSNMSTAEREDIIKEFVDKPSVIKPKSTNSGIGITIFSSKASSRDILNAVQYAFHFDNHSLIEKYIKGNEYRFLIVDNKCVSVIHRRSASVVGNGKSTIKELIDEKNKEPWHVFLDNPVVIDKVAKDFLEKSNYTFDSIPNNNERIYLRENSNCSTGGECIDMTDIMPKYFKQIAISATKCFKAKIAGIDIIIDDLNSKEYSIIEVNDNPGYSLNERPYEGKGDKVGLYILKMLGF